MSEAFINYRSPDGESGPTAPHTEQGEGAAAAEVTREVVALRPELAAAATGTDRDLAEAAAALHHAALRLLAADQANHAVAPAKQAVEILTKLATADAAYRPRLAVGMTNLAQVFAVCGRSRQAVLPAHKAVIILRECAGAHPAEGLPDLAAALVGLSQHLAPPNGKPSQNRRTAEAAALAAEAVEIYRRLEESSPAGCRADLAAALTNLGLRHAVAGSPGPALAALDQAVAIRRELAADDPARHRADLAASLTNLGLQLGTAERRAPRGAAQHPVAPLGHSQAVAAAEEAVALYRQDSSAGVRHDADLAAGLANLGYLLAVTGRLREACEASSEAITGYRQLCAGNPQLAHRLGLADTLHDLARHHTVAGHGGKAMDALTEAVDLYQEIAATYPDAVGDRLQAARGVLAALQTGLAGTGDSRGEPHARRVITQKIAGRYCRRWHEEMVRIALPGVMAFALWRTDLTPRISRQRTVRDDLIDALLDRGRGPETGTRPSRTRTNLPISPLTAAATVAMLAAGACTAQPAGRRSRPPLVPGLAPAAAPRCSSPAAVR